jgi:hypothetical protein
MRLRFIRRRRQGPGNQWRVPHSADDHRIRTHSRQPSGRPTRRTHARLVLRQRKLLHRLQPSRLLDQGQRMLQQCHDHVHLVTAGGGVDMRREEHRTAPGFDLVTLLIDKSLVRRMQCCRALSHAGGPFGSTHTKAGRGWQPIRVAGVVRPLVPRPGNGARTPTRRTG